MKQEDVEDGGLSSMREGRQRQAQANKNKLERRFPFPFPPYDIQQQFMDEMYAVLDKGGLGIFESPTGTVRPSSLTHNL
jgi:chromosome transmission fidelity protein 1